MQISPTSFAPALIMLDGLLAGLFIGSTLVEHAARTMGAHSWIDYKHAKEKVFAPVMPPVFLTCLLSTIAAAIFLPSHLVIGLAASLLAVVFAITGIVHLPLNKLFQSWRTDNYPVTWDDGRRRWRNWNLGRTGLVLMAFFLIVMGTA